MGEGEDQKQQNITVIKKEIKLIILKIKYI